jgi:hypothetical protein
MDQIYCTYCTYTATFDFIKFGLTPYQDYIATGNKKLYWLNLYCPYNRAEFHQLISCFKSVIGTTLSLHFNSAQ